MFQLFRPSWSPLLDPNLAAWFDPNDTANMVLGGGNTISSWTSKAGSLGWIVLQGIGAKQPVQVPGAGLSGGAVVRYSAAASQFLRCTVGALDQPSTILALVKSTKDPTAGNFGIVDGKDLNTRRLYNYSIGGHPALYSGANLVETVVTVRQNTWTKLGAIYTGAASIVRAYNTVDGTHQTVGNAGVAAATGITIGSDGGGASGFFDGDMGHVIAVVGVLTAAQIDTYFAWMQNN